MKRLIMWLLFSTVLLATRVKAQVIQPGNEPNSPPPSLPADFFNTQHADVTCSAEVNNVTCKLATADFQLLSGRISVTILSPIEYKRRIAQIEQSTKQQDEEVSSCMKEYPGASPEAQEGQIECSGLHFGILNSPFLIVPTSGDDIKFVRANPFSPIVGQVLISTDLFASENLVKDSSGRYALTKGEFDPYRVSDSLEYVMGVLDGVTGSVANVASLNVPLELQQGKQIRDLVQQYNSLVDKYNSLLHTAQTLASFPPTFVFPSSVSYTPTPPPINIHCATTNNGMRGMFYKTDTTCTQ